jgi:hypothetical protein
MVISFATSVKLIYSDNGRIEYSNPGYLISPILTDANKLVYTSFDRIRILNLDQKRFSEIKIPDGESFLTSTRSYINETKSISKPIILINNNEIAFLTTFQNKVYVSAYNINTGKLLWKTEVNPGAGVFSLDHRDGLALTPYGILYSSVSPFILYLISQESGKIKWTYKLGKDFSEAETKTAESAGSMAELRSFTFRVIYYFENGVILKLSYPQLSEDKYLLVDWNGRFLSKLNHTPLLFFKDKYLFIDESIDTSKTVTRIGCSELLNDNLLWTKEYSINKNDFLKMNNFLVKQRDISDHFYIKIKNGEKDSLLKISLDKHKIIWKKDYPKYSIRDLYETDEEIFIVFGETKESDDLSLLKLSSLNGSEIWKKKILLIDKAFGNKNGIISHDLLSILKVNLENRIGFSTNSIIQFNDKSDEDIYAISYMQLSKLISIEFTCMTEGYSNYSEESILIQENKDWIIASFRNSPDPYGFILCFKKAKIGSFESLLEGTNNSIKEKQDSSFLSNLKKL